jgi:23S rRNA G2445 N2-methylase RlmL
MRDRCKGLQLEPLVKGGGSADVHWFLFLYHDFNVFYKDMNSVSLHKRGHKDVMHCASLNEGIVIVIFTIASWNQTVIGFREAN